MLVLQLAKNFRILKQFDWLLADRYIRKEKTAKAGTLQNLQNNMLPCRTNLDGSQEGYDLPTHTAISPSYSVIALFFNVKISLLFADPALTANYRDFHLPAIMEANSGLGQNYIIKTA